MNKMSAYGSDNIVGFLNKYIYVMISNISKLQNNH